MATQVSDAGSKTRLRGGSSDELAVIAQRAQAFTNASGTAIALSEGSLDEIVCRARSGSSAPEVGTSLRVEGSFTGLCIQSGKELRCDDAETDTRVDTAAIRALGIRSMVVIPIKDEGRIVGVLAVFAPTAHAFTITHVAVLKTMADQIAAFLQRERKGRDEGHLPEPSSPVQVSAPKPMPVSAVPVMPPAVVIKPAPAAPARPQLPVVPKVEPVKASVAAVEAVPVGGAKRGKEPVAEPKEQKTEYRASFSTLDAAATPGNRSGNRTVVLGIGAAVAIAAIAGFAYYILHRPSQPVQQTQQTSNVQAGSASAGNPPSASAAVPSVASGTLPGSTISASRSSITVEPARKSEKPSAKTVAAASVPSAKLEEPQGKHEDPQPKREETVALSTAPSRISGSKDNAVPTADIAPAVTLGSVPASGNLSTLANPVSSSTPSMLAQSELEPVSVIKRVSPVYPMVAKQRMLSGSVVVEGVVDTTGKITNLKLVSGPPLFRDAAFDALKQWQFKPAKLNGQPIEQPTKVRLDFMPR